MLSYIRAGQQYLAFANSKSIRDFNLNPKYFWNSSLVSSISDPFLLQGSDSWDSLRLWTIKVNHHFSFSFSSDSADVINFDNPEMALYEDDH